MSGSYSSLTIKLSFERGTLCECGHRRLDHHMIDEYAEREQEEYDEVYPRPVVYCFCPCDNFKLISNLKYLEMLQKSSENII